MAISSLRNLIFFITQLHHFPLLFHLSKPSHNTFPFFQFMASFLLIIATYVYVHVHIFLNT